MLGFKTLKSKVLLMLMASITLVLVLNATVSSILITKLHRTTAEEKLLQNVAVLKQDLEKKKSKLITDGQRLQNNQALVASTHLIWKYQDPDSYQPLIFDVEKQMLADLLEQQVQGEGYAFAGISAATGEWLSFYDAREKKKIYGSYDNGQPLSKISDGGVVDYELPVIPIQDGRTTEQDIQYRLSTDKKDLILMSHFPIVNPNSNSTEVMAWLCVGYKLEKAFAESLMAKTASALIIHGHFENEESYLLVADNKRSDSAGSVITEPEKMMQDMHVNSGNNQKKETYFMHSDDYFAVMFPLQLDDNNALFFAFGLDKANLSDSLAAFKQSIFVVLFLSGLIVVPMGLLFARSSIIHPVARLTGFAESLTSGEMPRLIGFSKNDELGKLASAFNSMTEAIQLREESLRTKQREIEGIIENAPSVISMKTPDGKYLMVNHLFESLFNLSRDEIIGRTDMDIFPEESAQEFINNDLMIAETRDPIQFEESVMQGDTLHTYISNKFPLIDNGGNVIAICSIATDITERKKAELKLSLAKNIIDNASEAVVVTSLDSIIEDVNAAYSEISGYSRDEVIGQSPSILQSGHHDGSFYRAMWDSIHTTGRWEGEVWDKRKNGEVYPKNLSISTVYDDGGRPHKYVGVFSDITERKETEKELRRLAYFDALTGLPNRVMLYDRLEQAVLSAKRNNNLCAVMMLDLDRFKYVNDTLGHDGGDELLITVANQLKDLVRETDTVARIGGDEFKIILTDIKNADEASVVAQKIINDLKKPVRVKGRLVNIGVSIGIAICPTDGDEIDQLIKYADLALYKAKDSGRNCYQYFSNDLQLQVFDHLALENDMKKAMALGEFVLHYQPKINLSSGRISGVETLIRWQHPEKGMVSPDDFIPFAEETGLIVPLGEWVLDTACRQLRTWSEQLAEPLDLAINLSARQFQQVDLISMMKRIIKDHGIDPNQIELEITESMVMTDVDKAIETMEELRALGLRLAIDDFGTGYSSLSYLKRFPINTLKIDKSFVRDLTAGSEDSAIVRAIISMAEDLGVDVVAEGVETSEQLDFLSKHGCQYVQGYYFSKPLNVELFDDYIRDAEQFVINS